MAKSDRYRIVVYADLPTTMRPTDTIKAERPNDDEQVERRLVSGSQEATCIFLGIVEPGSPLDLLPLQDKKFVWGWLLIPVAQW
jgi:hypothetical protein